MDAETAWKDLTTRETQLRLHIIRSEEYLRHFDRDYKRQVFMLYLSIMLLLLFQSWFLYRTVGLTQWEIAMCVAGVGVLAILNCLLLIRTKMFLRRVNEAWIAPQEKIALDNLREERRQLTARTGTPKTA
ncbi:MAG: hypothetical protein AAGK14_03545 [Verrucomicrobiota bacterium]